MYSDCSAIMLSARYAYPYSKAGFPVCLALLFPVMCRCFVESLLEWDCKPDFDNHSWKRKIVAKKSDRAANRSALENKFLYSERNIVTHNGENFAVYNLFGKDYNKYEMKYWEELVLTSMFDAYQYILEIKEADVKEKLKTILNHYFVIVA